MNLLNIDIRKENPLKSIVKAGKIPVVRVGSDGFKNYRQEAYFLHREIDCIMEEGCFVSLGGIQGTYVSGGHYGQDIHIGWIEPDCMVLGTYFYGSEQSFCMMPAKERFDKALYSYPAFEDSVIGKSYDRDDFDYFTEAIVKEEDIHEAAVISQKDYTVLFQYSNDGFYKIFDKSDIMEQTLFYGTLSDEFVSHMGWKKGVTKDGQKFYKAAEKLDLTILFDNKLYKDLVLQEMFHYYTNGTFMKSDEYFPDLQKAFLDYMQQADPYVRRGETDSYGMLSLVNGLCPSLVRFNEHNLCFHEKYYKKSWEINVYAGYGDEFLEKTKMHLFSDSAEKEIITVENILKNDYLPFLHKFVEEKHLFEKYFGRFFVMEYPQWLIKAEAFCELEKKLGDLGDIFYTYDDRYGQLNICLKDQFSFQYDLALLDGVVETEHDGEILYFNIDCLPEWFDRQWLDQILDVLDFWKAFQESAKTVDDSKI